MILTFLNIFNNITIVVLMWNLIIHLGVSVNSICIYLGLNRINTANIYELADIHYFWIL